MSAVNGLLLAVDIHRLFDRNLLAIDPDSMTVVLHPTVTDPRYTNIAGSTVRQPVTDADKADPTALRRRLLELHGEDPRDI